MEKLLDTMEVYLLEKENATYRIHLPSIKWVNIILDNVQNLGMKHLSKEQEFPDDLLNIEFVVESDETDFSEEDYFNGG